MNDTSTTITSILFIIIFNLISKFLGLFREILIASKFGSTMEADTYFLALSATDIVTNLIWATISTTLIPILVEIEVKEGFERKLKYTNNIINIMFIVTAILTFVGYVATPAIIKFMGMGFEKQQYDLAVLLTRLGLPKLLFSGIIGILIAFMNSEHNFKSSSSIYAFANVIYILYLVYFADIYGINGLMVASLISVVIQFLVLLPESIKTRFKYETILDINDKYIYKFWILVIPVLFGSAMNEINVIIDRAMASSLITGSISSLNYANKINWLVLSVLITAITTVIFPIFSTKSSNKDIEGISKVLSYGVNTILLITIPVEVVLIIFAKPIVEILFQRGEFNFVGTIMTSEALVFYSVGLVAMAIRLIFTDVYYSIQDTKTPMFNAVISIILNIILNIYLVRYMQHLGLALSTSIANIVAAFLMYFGLEKKLGQLKSMSYLKCGIKSVVASIIMGKSALFIYNKAYSTVEIGSMSNLISLLIAIGISIIIYIILCLIMKVDEVYILFNKSYQIINRNVN